MAFRKLPTLGDKPRDVANGVENVKAEIAKRPTVSSYDASVGTNIVKHGQRTKPTGRYIIWSECGEIVDVDLDASDWTFSATAAGVVKVIWL